MNCRSSEHESDEIPNFSILRQFKPQLDQLRNLAQLQSQFVNGHPDTHLTPVSCLYIFNSRTHIYNAHSAIARGPTNTTLCFHVILPITGICWTCENPLFYIGFSHVKNTLNAKTFIFYKLELKLHRNFSLS